MFRSIVKFIGILILCFFVLMGSLFIAFLYPKAPQIVCFIKYDWNCNMNTYKENT